MRSLVGNGWNMGNTLSGSHATSSHCGSIPAAHPRSLRQQLLRRPPSPRKGRINARANPWANTTNAKLAAAASNALTNRAGDHRCGRWRSPGTAPRRHNRQSRYRQFNRLHLHQETRRRRSHGVSPRRTANRRLQLFRYLHDCSDRFRLERIAGWASHPLESAAFSRRIIPFVKPPRARAGSGLLPPNSLVLGFRAESEY